LILEMSIMLLCEVELYSEGTLNRHMEPPYEMLCSSSYVLNGQ